MNVSLEKQNLSSDSKQEINFTTSLPSSQTKPLVNDARQLPYTNEHETEGYLKDKINFVGVTNTEKKRSPEKANKISVKGVECLSDEKGKKGKMPGDFDSFSSIGQQHVERQDLFHSQASVTFPQSEDDGNMSESISDCVEREKEFDVSSTMPKKVICIGNREQLDERIKVGNNSKEKDVFEKSGEKSWLEPVTNFRSISTKGKETSVSLEDLIRGIVGALKCKQMNKINIDGLLSNIDDTVNLLINQGRLPGNEVSGECSDLQQMTLRNKTAELLQNLSTLRARSAAMSRLEINIGSQMTSIPCTIPPRPGPTVTACESKYGEKLHRKGSKSVLHHRMHKSMSNLAQLRARRDEAAFRIRQQRHKLTRIKDYINPSTAHRNFHEEKKSSSRVIADDSCVPSSSLLYYKSKQGPKPETLAFGLSKKFDMKSRSDEKSNLMSSNVTSKVDRILSINSGEGKFIPLEHSMVDSSLSFNPKPISGCNNSARISNNYSHQTKAKDLAIIEAPELELRDKRTLPSENYGRELSMRFFPPPDPYDQPTEQESRGAVPVQKIFDVHEMVSGIPRLKSPLEVSEINSRDLLKKTVLSSTSDGDMQDWEKAGLEKLPLVLKFSKCEEGESRDECEDYGSMTLKEAYEADKNHTSSDAEDTMCDGAIGPISHSQHLKHIVNMMDESRHK